MSELDDVLASMQEGVVVIDAQGRVTHWLGASGRLLGWSADQARGRHFDDLLDPNDANGNRTCVWPGASEYRMRTIKGSPEREMSVTTKSGKRVWVGVTTGVRRQPSGSVVAATAVLRDIRRRKQIDTTKSEVILAVAHELRSPLTSVKGFTSTLLHRWDRFDDADKKRLLQTINTDVDRVTRLIGELLDVSRLEAGRLTLNRRMVRINDIAAGVVDRLRPRARAHRIDCVFPEQFPQVSADSDKIEQVLTNLVENAVKYTPGGAIQVVGSVHDSSVWIEVSDEGAGVSAEHKKTVFAKFFRVGANASPGSGLGLYISKGLVEAHGGRIWVENNQGGGAVFTFTLPLIEESVEKVSGQS
ncbi:MAG: ATP-binding protein [Actinomycetota bacterium]